MAAPSPAHGRFAGTAASVCPLGRVHRSGGAARALVWALAWGLLVPCLSSQKKVDPTRPTRTERLIDALLNGDLHPRAAAYGLIQIGRPAVPGLVEVLRDPSLPGGRQRGEDVGPGRLRKGKSEAGSPETMLPALAWLDWDVAASFQWIRRHPDLRETWGPRLVAAWVLGKIGAEGAIPALAEVARGGDVELRCQAVAALAVFGKAADEELGRALALPNSGRLAALALARRGVRIAPVLRAALRAESPTARGNALFALGVAPRTAVTLLGDLTRLFGSSHDEDACLAAWVLTRMGPAAVPSVMQVLIDSDVERRKRAVGVLALLGEHAQPAAFLLVEQLDPKYPDLARWAAEALVSLGVKGRAAELAAPKLLALCKSESPWTRIGALEALGQIGVGEAAFEETLRKLLKHPDSAVQQSGLEVMERLGPRGVCALAEARALYENHANSHVRFAALQTVASLGAPAVDVLVVMLGDLRKMPVLRGKALDLEVVGTDAIPRLLEWARDANAGTRRAALEVLDAVGRGREEVTRAVIVASRDPDEAVRLKAVGMLGSTRVGGRTPAVTQLAALLSDGDSGTRCRAATVLGRMGKDARAAVPALVQALTSKHNKLRAAAVRALGKIGPGAAMALPELRRATRDPARNVAAHARVAVSRVEGR